MAKLLSHPVANGTPRINAEKETACANTTFLILYYESNDSEGSDPKHK